jgi:NTP pyrophosphatase (non-canonical NTP hydrolase)
MPLSFDDLRTANTERCEQSFHGVDEWSPTDWAAALAGEAGEACNLIKKIRRMGETPELIEQKISESGDTTAFELAEMIHQVGLELADVVTYADLLAARLGIDLGYVVSHKFNIVSDRVGSSVTLRNT